MKLLHGDCLELLPTLASGSIDLVLTDPPYGTTQNKWDSTLPLQTVWRELRRVAKPNAALVFTATQPFDKTLAASNIEAYRYEWIWEKARPVGHLNAKNRPLGAHENILVFAKGSTTYNPQGLVPHKKLNKRKHSSSNYGDAGTENWSEFTNYPRSVLRFPHDTGGFHPTQKPVALMEYLIRTYTNAGESVLDFTMGSGTTGVACVNAGREFVGIERDDKYFQIASDRIAAALSAIAPYKQDVFA